MNKNNLSVFAIVALYLFVSFFSIFSGYESIWKIWNVPGCPPHLLDSRIIAVSGESYSLGYNPLYDNPQHPFNKKLNYPRIWHLLFKIFDINRNHANIIGSSFIILFFAGVFMFLFNKQFDILDLVILSLVVMSPAAMLAIERGGTDLFVFFVMSLALSVSYISNIFAVCLLLFGSFLKLYPIFGLSFLLRENKRTFWFMFIAACTIFIFYLIYSMDDLRQVYLTTPKFAKSSFGVNVFWMGLNKSNILNLQLPDTFVLGVRISSYIMLIAVFIVALLQGLKNKHAYDFLNNKHIDAFRIGASIYIGCFLIGNNFDYRFIFLIFTIPYLLMWIRARDKINISVPLIALCTIIFSCWNYIVKRIIGMKLGFVSEEISNWILLFCLLYLFIASAPDWFLNYFHRLSIIFRNTKNNRDSRLTT
jgi:hypothetical protein